MEMPTVDDAAALIRAGVLAAEELTIACLEWHGPLRHGERRRRIDSHAREFHRTRRSQDDLRTYSHFREHPSRAELGARQPHDNRSRYRLVARRHGRARQPR